MIDLAGCFWNVFNIELCFWNEVQKKTYYSWLDKGFMLYFMEDLCSVPWYIILCYFPN